MKYVGISGMHRSGTSLLSNYLKICGLNLNGKLLDGDSGNIRGYFENEEVISIHREIIEKNNSHEFLRVFPDNYLLHENTLNRVSVFLDNLEEFSVDHFAWKDPRSCLFLEYWEKSIEKRGEKFYNIFIVRDPEEVIDSLIRRNTDSIIREKPYCGLTSWIKYNEEIVKFYKKNVSSSIVVHLDEFLDQPNSVVSLINNKFGLKLDDNVDLNSVYNIKELNKGRVFSLKIFLMKFYMFRSNMKSKKLLREINELKDHL